MRSLIFNLFGEGFDKESAVPPLVRRVFSTELSGVGFPLSNLLIFPTVCLGILIKMTRFYKELLSSWHGNIGSNSNIIQALINSFVFVISGGLGAVTFIHLYSGAIVGGWELSPLPSTRVSCS